jgi:hypothetical protein
MGKTKYQKLKISPDQLLWLRERFAREAYKIAGLTMKERSERLPLKILSLKKKIDNPAVTDTVLVDRHDLSILEQQTANYVTVMRTKTLPEYEKRINKDPQAAAHYTPYRDAELARVEMLSELLNQVEELLKK